MNTIDLMIEKYQNKLKHKSKSINRIQAFKAIKEILESQEYFNINDLQELLPSHSPSALLQHCRYLVQMKVLYSFKFDKNRHKYFIANDRKEYLKGIIALNDDLIKLQEFINKLADTDNLITKNKYKYYIDKSLNRMILSNNSQKVKE